MWDLHSCSVEHVFKGGISAAKSLCIVGNSILLSAEQDKPLLHNWVLKRRDSKQNRIILPGKVTAAVTTKDGHYYIAAIGQNLHIWELSSGRLLALVSAHYQPIRCVCVTEDGSSIITGGDDAIVHCWSFSSLVDGARNVAQNTPTWSFSNHSLPVTDLCVDSFGAKSRVFTISADQTCRLYDISTSEQLATFVFDTGLSQVISHTAQSTFYVGTLMGHIYRVSLYPVSMKSEYHVSTSTDKNLLVFNGHSAEVTCLVLNIDGSILASGSKDMSVKLWHTSSGQCIRTLPHKGSITNLLITSYPSQLSSELFSPVAGLKQLERHLHGNNDIDGTVEVTIPDTQSQEEQDILFCRQQASSVYQLSAADRLTFSHTGQLPESSKPQSATQQLETKLFQTEMKLSNALTANKELYQFCISKQV